jgi:hypothetical protein
MDEATGTSGGGKQARANPGRWLRRVGVVVAVIVVVVASVVVTARLRSGSPSAPTRAFQAPSPMELPLFRDAQRCGASAQPTGCTYDEMLCPTAVAWSPDERQVAILSHCGGFHGSSNKVLVFDASDAHLGATIALDELISRSSLFPDTCDGTPEQKALTPYDLFWLPSGRLAVVGLAYLWTALNTGNSCTSWDALVLIDADGTHAQLARVDSREQAGGNGPCGRTWDLLAASPSPASTAGDDCPLTPALGYSWAADGGLEPQTPLNDVTVPPAPGPGPVGNPEGGAQFTVWQSATVTRSQPATMPGAAADLYEMFERLGAFSPDGHYGYGNPPLIYRLEPAGQPTPVPSDLQQAGADTEPLLPVKDAALQHVLTELPQPIADANGLTSTVLPTAIAWRPDGAMLAALGTVSDGNGGPTDVGQSVRLLDCTSGTVRLSLTPVSDLAHKQAFGTSLILSWSPDGSRLLLISGARGAATLWNLSGLH